MELDIKKVKNDIRQLTAAMAHIDARAAAESRPLNEAEVTWMAECQDAIKESRLSLPEKALTVDYGPLGGSSRPALGDALPNALRGPNDRKDYYSLFGKRQDYAWKDESIGFFHAVVAGRHHPDLRNSALTEGVESDGGFLVPVEQSARIHAVSLENELVMPRCFVQPMISNTIKLPAMSIGSHSTNLFGGFTASYTAEQGQIHEHNPTTRSMELNAKKLTGLLRFSNELVQDIPGGENQIVQICGKGLAWYRDRAFLKGTGAGEPLGILNASCVVAVAKETGQKADTIVYENLTKMMARMYAGSFANSVWVAHQSTIPQLLTLSLAVGTAGSAIPVLNQANGQFTILTRPVIFTEKTENLGDKGDIMLADFSQYVVGLRGEMRFDTSIHVGFTTDELYARLIERHDGQPLWNEPLSLEDGTTVSPFVVLAERA